MKSLIVLIVCCTLLWCSLGALAQDGAYVQHVIDGDTVVLRTGRHLRYIGIDAPEIFHKENTAQPFGYAARDYNRQLVENGKVFLVFDREHKDGYQRLLAYVYDKDQRFINRLMLLHGYAYYLYVSPNTRYHDLLLQAQRTAMKEGRGIWEQGTAQKNIFIGNTKSKRFHLPACPFGKRLKYRNRIEFHSKREAFWEGYAPCKRCLPVGPLRPSDRGAGG